KGRNGRDPVIRNTRFIACAFSGVHFPRSLFDAVSFRDCSFDNCDFRSCIFYQCDLRFTRFSQATFQGTTMYLCDLFRAWFQDANVFADKETRLRLLSLDRTELGGAEIPWEALSLRTRSPWRRSKAEEPSPQSL